MVSPRTRRVITGPAARLHVRFHAHRQRGRGGRPRQPARAAAAWPPSSAVSTGGRTPDGVSLPTSGFPRAVTTWCCVDGTARMQTRPAAPVWVYGRAARARSGADRPHLPRGSPDPCRWTGRRASNLDWIGLYRCRRTCGGPGSYLIYRYTRTDDRGLGDVRRRVYLGEGRCRLAAAAGTVRRAVARRRQLPSGRPDAAVHGAPALKLRPSRPRSRG